MSDGCSNPWRDRIFFAYFPKKPLDPVFHFRMKAGVGAETLRLYEQKDLLPTPLRNGSGYRV